MPYSLERIALAIDTSARPGLQPAAVSAAREKLELQALELARAADLLNEIIPGEASPVVIQRRHFAELQAALDAYRDAGADLVLASEEPDDA